MTSLNIAQAANAPWPIVCSAPLRWFLVRAKPSSETTAQLNLERQGYRVYYPRLLRPTLYRGRWIERIVALFPRYLFIQLDAGRQSLAPVRSTAGVANIVSFGLERAIVQDAVVDGLIQRADPETGLHHLKHTAFESGAKVRILSGALSGLEGIFEREAGKDRVVVLFSLLGGTVSVHVPASSVGPGYAA